jgi:hypothetical protein
VRLFSLTFDVDYQSNSASMNLVLYMAIKHYPTKLKNWYNEFNRGRSSLQDEFREGRPKSAFIPENIDAVRELIIQDRHATYREIQTSMNISMTPINKILHDHLTVKKICLHWIPHNLTIGWEKVLRKLVPTHAKVYLSSWKNNNTNFDEKYLLFHY